MSNERGGAATHFMVRHFLPISFFFFYTSGTEKERNCEKIERRWEKESVLGWNIFDVWLYEHVRVGCDGWWWWIEKLAFSMKAVANKRFRSLDRSLTHWIRVTWLWIWSDNERHRRRGGHGSGGAGSAAGVEICAGVWGAGVWGGSSGRCDLWFLDLRGFYWFICWFWL